MLRSGFGPRLLRARLRAGLSSSKLSERLGVSKGAVSNWETGKNYPDMSRVEDIATALDASIEEFFDHGRTDRVPPKLLNLSNREKDELLMLPEKERLELLRKLGDHQSD